MTLLDSFYHIVSSGSSTDGYSYTIGMDAGHPIYKAHFPQRPITPGVCILQIGRELLSQALGKKLELVSARNVKFLSVLSPDGNPVNVSIHHITQEPDGKIAARIDFTRGDSPVAKLSIICRIAG